MLEIRLQANDSVHKFDSGLNRKNISLLMLKGSNHYFEFEILRIFPGRNSHDAMVRTYLISQDIWHTKNHIE